MSDRFRLTLAQLSPVAGDIDGNADRIRAAWQEGRAAGADLVACPEMCVTGHPAGALVADPAVAARAMAAAEALARECADGPALAVGAPAADGGDLHNAYWICRDGAVTARVLQHAAPGTATFAPGPISGPYRAGPVRIGSPIGADALSEDVAEAVAESGAEILLVPNASPHRRGRHDERLAHMVARTVETGLPLVYLNMVGGQDGQVCDGASFVLNPGGELACQLPFCAPALRYVDFVRGEQGWRARRGARDPRPDADEADYHIMVTALRDHCTRVGVPGVVLGLSGGADGALVAAIAADALGPANLRCVPLPSDRAGAECRAEAAALARALGCPLVEVPLDAPRRAMDAALAPAAGAAPPEDFVPDMLSRLGVLAVAALAEGTGALPLAAASRTAIALGAAPDFYDPVADLSAARVRDACRWRNACHRDWMLGPAGAVVPQGAIEAPWADGGAGLPPPPVLDEILERLRDRGQHVAAIVASGHDRKAVEAVAARLRAAERLRMRAAPGPRLAPRAARRDPG